MLDFVLNLLFPPICGICGKLDRNWLCSKCKKRLKKYEKFEFIQGKEKINYLFKYYNLKNNFSIKENIRETNDKQISDNPIINNSIIDEKVKKRQNEEIFNKNKIYYKDFLAVNNRVKIELDIRQVSYFDEFFYCFEYKGIIRNLLLKYKFSDASYLSYFFSNIMLNNKKINEIFKNYDIMIPVPMDQNKKNKRGYNQTELITKIIEKNIKNKQVINKNNFINENQYMNKNNQYHNKPFINKKNDINENLFINNNENDKLENNIIKKELLIENNCLIKVKSTKTQSTLNAEERMINIKNAFCVKNIEKIKNKKIILFDDIITTGATVNEISKILKMSGAEKILVLVIAKD